MLSSAIVGLKKVEEACRTKDILPTHNHNPNIKVEPSCNAPDSKVNVQGVLSLLKKQLWPTRAGPVPPTP